MPWDIELYHPATGSSISSSSLAMQEAIHHRNSTGDSIEANITHYPEPALQLLRRLLRIVQDGNNKFFGVVTATPNRNLVDKLGTTNVSGARQRLYETPMTQSYVPGGDVGTMVTNVLGVAANIPVGLTFAGGVGTFGFVLGDRITKRSESVGDFLDAMAQALPGFVVPGEPERSSLLGAFPEMASLSPGEVLLGAAWGVLPNRQIFFGRRDSSQTLNEGADCFVYEQETIDAEKIVTVIRWIIDEINLHGHMTIKDSVGVLPVNPLAHAVGLNWQLFGESEGSLPFAIINPISSVIGKGEVISYDAVNQSLVNEWGKAFKTYRLDDYEVAFSKNAVTTAWQVIWGEALSTLNDIQTPAQVVVRPNVDGIFAMYLDIPQIQNYDGLYIDAPGCEVSWYLTNNQSVYPFQYAGDAHVKITEPNPISFENFDFAYEQAPQTIVFSKRELAWQGGSLTGAARLAVTLKCTDRDGVGNFYEEDIEFAMPFPFVLLDVTPFQYTVKENEQFLLYSFQTAEFLNNPYITVSITFFGETVPEIIWASGAPTANFVFAQVLYPGDVLLFEKNAAGTTFGDVEVFVRGKMFKRTLLPDNFTVHYITYADLSPAYDAVDSFFNFANTPSDTPALQLPLPYTRGIREMQFVGVNFTGKSVRARIFGTPTATRTINAAYLVRKNDAMLRRLAQNLYEVPALENMTIECKEFREPTRRINIPGRGELFPTKFTDILQDGEWTTIITVGQPENADDEALTALVRERAQLEARNG